MITNLIYATLIDRHFSHISHTEGMAGVYHTNPASIGSWDRYILKAWQPQEIITAALRRLGRT